MKFPAFPHSLLWNRALPFCGKPPLHNEHLAQRCDPQLRIPRNIQGLS